VEDRGELGSGPSGDPIEASFLVWAELASALRDIQNNGCSCAIELILEVSSPAGHGLDDGIAQVEDVQGALIDIEAFVIEGYAQLSVRAWRSCG
jgi:hypothetical protein